MMMKVLFFAILLFIAFSATGQLLRGTGISATTNRLGQSGSTLDIKKEDISQSDEERRLTFALAGNFLKSENIFKSEVMIVESATAKRRKPATRTKNGTGKKKGNGKKRLSKKQRRQRRRKRLARKKKRLRMQQRSNNPTPPPTPQPTEADSERRRRPTQTPGKNTVAPVSPPSTEPSTSTAPSNAPSKSPAPTYSFAPSKSPTASPAPSHSVSPSSVPSESSMSPSSEPSSEPPYEPDESTIPSNIQRGENLVPLIEGEWIAVAGTIDGKEINSKKCISLTLEDPLTEGLALGFSGCNYYRAYFETTPDLNTGSIKMKSPPSSTKMGCRDGSMETEEIYLQFLGECTSYEVDDNTLKLSGPSGSTWTCRRRTADDVDCQ